MNSKTWLYLLTGLFSELQLEQRLRAEYIVLKLLETSALKSLIWFITMFSQYSSNHVSISKSNSSTVKLLMLSLSCLFGSKLILFTPHTDFPRTQSLVLLSLNHVFRAVVNGSLAGVIFILFTKPKGRKNNPLLTPTTSSVPGGLQPRQNKEEYFKKTLHWE